MTEDRFYSIEKFETDKPALEWKVWRRRFLAHANACKALRFFGYFKGRTIPVRCAVHSKHRSILLPKLDLASKQGRMEGHEDIQ